MFIIPKNKDIQIHAHGGGHLLGWDDKQYRKLYDDLIRNKILYHGGKSSGKTRMVKHLNGCQIFLYPVAKHIQETFCLVVLEAMAAGCVVISNNSGNLKDLVGDAGYVISGNTDDYKWQIEATEKAMSLFKDYTLMLELSKKAREVAKKYTWERTVDKLEALI